jgi:hypothetical protein
MRVKPHQPQKQQQFKKTMTPHITSESIVGFFPSHGDQQSRAVTIADIVQRIRTPAPAVQALVAKIRTRYAAVGGGQAAKDAIKSMKGGLPCVTFAACGTRKVPRDPTGMVVLDFDVMGSKLRSARARLECDPHVALDLLSPSGDGLKAVFAIPIPTGTEAEMRFQHLQSFHACCAYAVERLGLPQPDQSGKDMLRLCYLTHDPEVFFNPTAIPLDVAAWRPNLDETASADPAAKNGHDEARTAQEEVVEALLQSIPPRPDYMTWLKISASVRNSLKSDERAIAILKAWSPEEHEGEYTALLASSSFSRIGFGTLRFHARQHGFWGVKGKFAYAGRWGYAIRVKGHYIPLPKENQVKEHLKSFGVPIVADEFECTLCDIRTEQFVSYIGPIAGHVTGLHEFQGDRLVVTKGPTIIEAGCGDASFITEFVRRLLVLGSDERQLQAFMAWLAHCRKRLKLCQRGQSPAMAVAGSSGCGKSLLIEIVCRCLGGRSANAYPCLSGDNRFGADLIGAELLVIDDAAASKDHRARLTLAQNIKNSLFAGSVRVEGKNKDAFNCAPVQALMIAVNDDPQHLRVLPELDETMRDKIILLSAQSNALPSDMVGNRDLISAAIDRALPAFLHQLETTDFQQNYDPQTGRLRCFWNGEIVASIGALSPEMHLVELLWQCPEVANSVTSSGEWVGTASQLQALLTRYGSDTKHAAERLLCWQGACGTFLGRLCQDPDTGVTKAGLTAESRIQQYRIGLVAQCEGEEVRSGLATSL